MISFHNNSIPHLHLSPCRSSRPIIGDNGRRHFSTERIDSEKYWRPLCKPVCPMSGFDVPDRPQGTKHFSEPVRNKEVERAQGKKKISPSIDNRDTTIEREV